MTAEELKKKIHEAQHGIQQGLTAIEQLKTKVSALRGKIEAYAEMLQELEKEPEEASE